MGDVFVSYFFFGVVIVVVYVLSLLLSLPSVARPTIASDDAKVTLISRMAATNRFISLGAGGHQLHLSLLGSPRQQAPRGGQVSADAQTAALSGKLFFFVVVVVASDVQASPSRKRITGSAVLE